MVLYSLKSNFAFKYFFESNYWKKIKFIDFWTRFFNNLVSYKYIFWFKISMANSVFMIIIEGLGEMAWGVGRQGLSPSMKPKRHPQP